MRVPDLGAAPRVVVMEMMRFKNPLPSWAPASVHPPFFLGEVYLLCIIVNTDIFCMQYKDYLQGQIG